jgi:hypothetical protein
MYLDSFLKLAQTDEASVNDVIERLAQIGEKFGVTFVLSISVASDAISDKFKDAVIAEL